LQTLGSELEIKGYTLRQQARVDSVAIYEQSKGGTVYGYEVVRINHNEAWAIAGKQIPARESYPGPETWGARGFTCFTMAEAERKMAQVLREIAEFAVARAARGDGPDRPVWLEDEALSATAREEEAR
jgi:hypothetical protein